MKKALLLTFVLMLGASMAFAQGQGSVGIFADPAGASCNLTDTAMGLKSFYIVHVYTTGSTASQYSAPKPACFTGSYLSDTNAFGVTIGNSQTGVSVGYGGCKTGAVLTQTLNFFAMGTTGACCYYPVLADPNLASGQIETVDCSFNPGIATGGKGIVNSNLSCNCNVPAEDTTWGNVKALYNE